jgi:glutamate/tyrosine decarboxylase-like PLP-dependent enzyme
VDKAVDLLGIGWKQLRKLPTDEQFRIRVDRLEQAIAADRGAGLRPAIVVGNAGTVNTGAIDPLDELADLCAREGLWFHVDGAYGAMASVSPRLRPLFAGLERADSVAADPHKWLYVPYEAGATLVRDPGRMAEAFRRPAPYLVHDPTAVLGPASQRAGAAVARLRALKVYMACCATAPRYARAIGHDLEMARFSRGRGGLTRAALPPELSIVNSLPPAGGAPMACLDT